MENTVMGLVAFNPLETKVAFKIAEINVLTAAFTRMAMRTGDPRAISEMHTMQLHGHDVAWDCWMALTTARAERFHKGLLEAIDDTVRDGLNGGPCVNREFAERLNALRGAVSKILTACANEMTRGGA